MRTHDCTRFPVVLSIDVTRFLPSRSPPPPLNLRPGLTLTTPSGATPASSSSKTFCSFCGRENDATARYCSDCGKALTTSAAVVQAAYAPASGASGVPKSAEAGGGRREAPGALVKCRKCGNMTPSALPFCGYCGTRIGDRVSVSTRAPVVAAEIEGQPAVPRISVLDEEGHPAKFFTLDRGEAIVGRGDADIRFDFDVYLSPLHARLDMDNGVLTLRDLGSRNGSWVFIDQPTKLIDGDLILVGSQVIRFRRLGYPGPHPPEADATRRMGSVTPPVDVAVLEQLRADGSVRDVFHLSPGRSAVLGREMGDWVFPYDQTMSGKHAEIVSEDIEFFVHDSGSRNGVAMSVRGDRELRLGQRFLLGDQILRVENV